MKKRYMIPALLACSGFCMAGTASVAAKHHRPPAGRGVGGRCLLGGKQHL